MARIEHVACGYSPFAPGCDEASCLMSRIDYAGSMGWSTQELEQRFDLRVDRFLAETLAVAEAESVARAAAAQAAAGTQVSRRRTDDG